MKDRSFLYSISVLIGTIVGVGVFGIPFSFAKAGFLTGVLFLVLITVLSLVINLIYGEIILRTGKLHQFIGYTREYLGTIHKILSVFSWFLGVYGALLAYIIISGNFLFNIFISKFYFDPFYYSIIFFIFVALATLGGLRTVAWFELFMVIFFTATVFLIFIFGIPYINLFNLTGIFNKEFWFLPYGVLLFAFSGFSAIPIQRELLGEKSKFLKKAIILGTLIPAVLYLLFAISVVGISGDTTSPDAISGLADFLNYKILFFVSLFGFLAITTSFLMLSLALIETFTHDYNLNRFFSWFLTLFLPFGLFFSGLRNFINIISITGAVSIGIFGIILILLYLKIKKIGDRIPEYSLNIPKWALYLMLILFIIGIGYALAG